MADSGADAPAHFRSLGRSAFLAAALDADKQLDKVARSFDFLLSVSPINSREAMERFFADGEAEAPKFRYRPLTVDPDAAKRDLYAVDLSIIEDPLLERLLSEKRQEIDHQLTMLSTRNTAAFKAASLLHYGTVGSQLLADAQAILARPKPRKPSGRSGRCVGGRRCGARAGRQISGGRQALRRRHRSARRRQQPDGFGAQADDRQQHGDAAVTGRRPAGARSQRPPAHPFQRRRPRASPFSVPALPIMKAYRRGSACSPNGRSAGFPRRGCDCSPGAWSRSTRCSTAPSSSRSIAASTDGHGLSRKPAFDIATRVFRSGGFAKDLIYLKGFQDVIGLVAAGASLDAFWIGKIARDHVDEIEELMQRKLIQPPVFKPEFLQREDVKSRIARLRGKSSFARILDAE